MRDVDSTKITAVKTKIFIEKFAEGKTKYSGKEEKVFQVDEPQIDVAPDETVDILIPGKEGFTVFLPYAGVFNAQVFEAVKNPYWAADTEDAKMQAASGEIDSGESATVVKATKEDVWGVRMTRIVKEDQSPIKEMPYCIYSKELNNFAVGNSPPTMKLDP